MIPGNNSKPVRKPDRLVAIVCTKDRPERVSDFVANLITLGVPPRTLLLVDSTSSHTSQLLNQESMNRLKRHGWDARHLIDTPGLPHQRNTGLGYVSENIKSCEFVSFLDDDIFIGADYFEKVELVFNLDPKIVVVGGYDIEAAEQVVKTNLALSKIGILPYSDGLIAKSGLARVPRPTSIADDVDFVPGGMQSLRIGLLGEVRFNEASAFFGEDIEMHFKLSTQGRVVSSNSLPVRHLNATEGKEDNGANLLNEQLVRLRLHLENPKRVTYTHLILGCLVVFAWESLSVLSKGNFKKFVGVSREFSRALVISLSRRTAPDAK